MVASSKPDVLESRQKLLLSDEPPLETDRHLNQIMLLLWCLKWWWRERPEAPPERRNNFYAAGNLTIYYSSRQRRNEHFRGPDFFVVIDITEYRERTSWVVWEEDGKYPNLIIEMLSDSTAETDRGPKREIYQNVFSTPEYFWFDPYSLEFQGLRLSQEREYVEITPNERGWMWRWSEQLELYLGIVEEKQRFLTATGELVPDPTESSLQERLQKEAERQRAEAERQRAEAERQRADTAEAQLEMLRSRLQELGIDADELN